MTYSWTEFHGAVTHFPVAMITAGFVFELGGRVLKKSEWKTVGYWSLFGGAVGGIASLASGIAASSSLFGTFMSVPPLAATHRAAAYVTVLSAATLLVWRSLANDRLHGRLGLAALACYLITAACVGYTGYLGGLMVFNGQNSPSDSLAARTLNGSARAVSSSAPDAAVVAGAGMFKRERCITCHRIDGAGGAVGPDLSHEGRRQPSVQWQIDHLIDPDSMHHGSFMPSYKGLTSEQLSILARFVVSNR